MDTINGKAFSRLLQRVSLGGLINECVIHVKKGVATITAVDLSNSLFIHCSEEISDAAATTEFGINNIALLVSFVGDVESLEVKFSDKWLTLKRKGGTSLKCLSIAPGEVPTEVSEAGAADKLFGIRDNTTEIKAKTIENLMFMVGLVKSKAITFTAKDGELVATSAAADKEQFRVRFGQTKAKDFSVVCYAEHAMALFRTLSGLSELEGSISIQPDKPIIVDRGATNFWALTPLAE